MIVILIVIASGAVGTLYLHEISHIIANNLVGREIIEVVLWPHFKNGKFYFSRVQSLGPSEGMKWVHVSPVIKCAVFANIWLFLTIFTQYPHFLILLGWEVMDAAWWLKGYSFGPTHTDGYKFKES